MYAEPFGFGRRHYGQLGEQTVGQYAASASNRVPFGARQHSPDSSESPPRARLPGHGSALQAAAQAPVDPHDPHVVARLTIACNC